MSTEVMPWALPRLQRLLPIDDESLREIVTYTISLSKEAGAEHLQNILGDSTQSLEFISGFNSRRPDVKAPTPRSSTPTAQDSQDGVPRHTRKQKPRAPLHNAGPMRRPEGYGDVTGGYTKQVNMDDNRSRGHKKGNSAGTLFDLSLSQHPEALQVPKVTQGGLQTPSSARSRDPSPGTPSLLPPSASGKLISDLPNVRTKQSKKPVHQANSQPHSGTSTPSSRPATTTTSSIADLTSAIAALELSTNPTLSNERRRCDCNASIHPLFTTAPNCLNCGKIICALEGLQPCSSCNSPILSRDQVNGMIRALKEERGVEKMATHNASIAGTRSGGGTPMFSNTPDTSGDEGGASSAAARARAHRDRLLGFQRENAQRTKVHDEAADYDVTMTPGATQWMSATQRAAALKKQQAYLRELEESSRPEWERKRTVMSMTVKGGKLVRTYEKVQAPSLAKDEVEEIEAEEEVRDDERQRLGGGSGAFSKNPLLVSGSLIRPVWKPKEGDAEDVNGKAPPRERKSVWRKVQDDNEDNEQWILDGGLRGYGVESRTMEDGSQQEAG